MNFFGNLFGGGQNNGGQSGGQPSGAANIFNNGGSQPQGGQQPNQQVNNGPGSSLENPGGMQGNQGNQGQQGQQGQQTQNSPLDEMAKLWETDPNKQGNQPPADPFAEPLFTMDPAKLRESSSKLDFVGQVSPELVQKALSGDSQALMQVINQTAQHAVSTSLQMSTMLAEQTGAKLGQRVKGALPTQMRQFQLDNTPPQTQILQNPAVSPMLKLIRERIAVNNPNLRPAEVAAKAEQYMLDMATAIRGDVDGNRGDGSNNQQQQPGVVTDFSNWG